MLYVQILLLGLTPLLVLASALPDPGNRLARSPAGEEAAVPDPETVGPPTGNGNSRCCTSSCGVCSG